MMPAEYVVLGFDVQSFLNDTTLVALRNLGWIPPKPFHLRESYGISHSLNLLFLIES